VLQECDGLAVFNENEPAPAAGLEANVDIFFFTLSPPQEGQTTSSILLRLSTRSSKVSSHSVQINSKIGMVLLLIKSFWRFVIFFTTPL
jgi:hypothetical protein